MTDKEVGRLWVDLTEGYLEGESSRAFMADLIRKLVDERTMYFWRIGKSKDEALSFALRDFGIDPEDWTA